MKRLVLVGTTLLLSLVSSAQGLASPGQPVACGWLDPSGPQIPEWLFVTETTDTGTRTRVRTTEEIRRETYPITIRVNIPASFPNPASERVLSGAWEVNCGETRLVSDGEKVIASSPKGLEQVVSDLTGGGTIYDTKGNIDIYTTGVYQYPSIGVGYRPSGMRVGIKDGFVTLSGDSTIYRVQAVGYKINDGELRQMFFEGRYSEPVSLGQNTVDIYIKQREGGPFGHEWGWERVVIDGAKGTVTLYKFSDFPAN